jgi:hypothetical protein
MYEKYLKVPGQLKEKEKKESNAVMTSPVLAVV